MRKGSQAGEKNNNYGKHLSVKARKRLSDERKGIPKSEDHKRKIGDANKGKRRSPETINGMRERMTGHVPWNKGKTGVYSEETRLKMAANKGKVMSEEQKIKISKGLMGVTKGSVRSEDQKRKQSKSMMGKYLGEKGPGWKGGITPFIILIRNSTKYAQWRQDCFIRDRFSCQKCGDDTGGNLNVHHKKPFSKLFEEARNYMPLFSAYEAALIYTPMWRLENGVTLCEQCHRKRKR